MPCSLLNPSSATCIDHWIPTMLLFTTIDNYSQQLLITAFNVLIALTIAFNERFAKNPFAIIYCVEIHFPLLN